MLEEGKYEDLCGLDESYELAMKDVEGVVKDIEGEEEK